MFASFQYELAELIEGGAGGQGDKLDLASGFNQINWPAGADIALFIPPGTNTQTLTLKGVTTDGGIAMHPGMPFVVSAATAGSGSFGITAGAAVAGCRILFARTSNY